MLKLLIHIYGGTPKMMVFKGKCHKMDNLGVPLFQETAFYRIHTSRTMRIYLSLGINGPKAWTVLKKHKALLLSVSAH